MLRVRVLRPSRRPSGIPERAWRQSVGYSPSRGRGTRDVPDAPDRSGFDLRQDRQGVVPADGVQAPVEEPGGRLVVG